MFKIVMCTNSISEIHTMIEWRQMCPVFLGVDSDDFSSLADVHHLHSDRSTSTASDVHG